MSTAGIVLAAGTSSRFGAPKPLLPWENDNLLNTVITTAKSAGLSPVVVVLGANADQILPSVQGGVCVAVNPLFPDGVSTSIRVGLEMLTDEVDGVLFLHADQPQVSVRLLDAIKEVANEKHTIVRPVYVGRPGSPVYFPKSCFQALKSMQGDEGGRQVMAQFRVTQLEWLDETMGWDVDTPEDYLKLRKAYGLGPLSKDGL